MIVWVSWGKERCNYIIILENYFKKSLETKKIKTNLGTCRLIKGGKFCFFSGNKWTVTGVW